MQESLLFPDSKTPCRLCKVGVVSRGRRMGSSLENKSAGNPGVKLNMAISPPSVGECWETLENAEKCVLCIL